MYQTISEGNDFIILDDPISSFDNNKKFAILNMLFGDFDENFRGKTVLMLTHDFEPVIDIIKNGLPKQLSDNKNAYFLENKNGILREKEIRKDDIKTFNKICTENLEKEIDILNKCIFLRRKFEIEDNKGLEYNLLSSLIHKRDIPSIKRNGIHEDMTEEELDEAIGNIGIENFNYNKILANIKNEDNILEIYKNSKSNYEKLQVHRILKDNGISVEVDDSVIKKFIDESFHIENDYLFQLNPIDFELVPEYIIEACNEDLGL